MADYHIRKTCDLNSGGAGKIRAGNRLLLISDFFNDYSGTLRKYLDSNSNRPQSPFLILCRIHSALSPEILYAYIKACYAYINAGHTQEN